MDVSRLLVLLSQVPAKMEHYEKRFFSDLKSVRSRLNTSRYQLKCIQVALREGWRCNRKLNECGETVQSFGTVSKISIEELRDELGELKSMALSLPHETNECLQVVQRVLKAMSEKMFGNKEKIQSIHEELDRFRNIIAEKNKPVISLLKGNIIELRKMVVMLFSSVMSELEGLSNDICGVFGAEMAKLTAELREKEHLAHEVERLSLENDSLKMKVENLEIIAKTVISGRRWRHLIPKTPTENHSTTSMWYSAPTETQDDEILLL